MLILSSILFSCSDNGDERERHMMKDGATFYTDHDIEFYNDPYSFREVTEENDTRTQVSNDNIELEKDSLYGYNDVLKYTKWSKVKFGEWIKSYGLSTDSAYFVATITVSKYIPATMDDWIIAKDNYYSAWDEDSIGTNTMTWKMGFSLASSISYGYYKATTQIKCIAYNEDGENVSLFFPVEPDNLKWKFFKIKRIW